jgi:stage II sporulation protein D
VEVDGQPYRGTLEVRILGDSLKVINQLNIEDYLRGVVPNEMGPNVYSELEALKAQAVAARTYIVANRGQFSDSGFDICDSPSCQVYRGFGTEHPLTNQAVEETAGIIAGYNGGPIKALYTSTCGGHTEDAVNIFSDLKLPYLKGVDCYPEVMPPTVLVGRDDLPFVEAGGGTLTSSELGLLFVSGVVGEEAFKKKYLQEDADPGEALLWWRQAFVLMGAGHVPPGFRFTGGSRLEWSRFMVAAFGWEERARLTLDPRDLPYVLSARDADQVPPADADTVAFLLKAGILIPYPDDTLRIGNRPLRATVLGWIYRAADRFQSIDLRKGIFRGGEAGSIQVGNKGSSETFPLAPHPCLYQSNRGRSYPMPTLYLAIGDPLTFHLNGAGQVDAVVLDASSRGAADDRSSSFSSWEVRYTRQELEDLLRKRVDMGRLEDVVVTKRGVSGRVIQVKIIGSRGTFTLNGFKIRTALGVRENLFTIERQTDPGGGFRAFTLAGKGWGHGVGLCQVGAYGMALRGESFDRILKHYYPGVELIRLY